MSVPRVIPPNPNPQQPHARNPQSFGLAVEFSGPLPPPQILDGYERACPGTANRIIEMAEAQSAHRRLMEQRALEGQIDAMRHQFAEARRGQVCACLVALAFVACGTYCIVHGYEWAGSGIGAVGLGGIVTTFILGRSAKPEEKVTDAPKKKKRK